jgi:hypothetical protein
LDTNDLGNGGQKGTEVDAAIKTVRPASAGQNLASIAGLIVGERCLRHRRFFNHFLRPSCKLFSAKRTTGEMDSTPVPFM